MSNPYESPENTAQPSEKPFVPRGVRVFAVLLMVGGVSFLLTAAIMIISSESSVALTIGSVVMTAIALVFGYTGIQLWQGQRWAYKVGMVLYLLQTPVISNSIIVYSLLSGVGFMLTIGSGVDTTLGFNFHFGGNLQFWIGADPPGWIVGINVVGAVGARYLFMIIRDLDQGIDLRKGKLPEFSSVLTRLAGVRRMVYVPVTQHVDGDLTDSKFSGLPAVSDQHPWPNCPNCGNKMQLFWQLDLNDSGLNHDYPVTEGLLQVFYCVTDEPLCEHVCESYSPFSRATTIRVVPVDDVLKDEAPKDHFPARKIVGWKVIEDYPNASELEQLGIKLSDAEAEVFSEKYPLAGDKVAGWPYWVQGEEYPDCPQCSEPMEYLLQIDSEVNIPHMFGDAGVGHLTYCKTHPEVMSFHWACH